MSTAADSLVLETHVAHEKGWNTNKVMRLWAWFFRAPSGFINNLVRVVFCFYDVFSHDVLVEAKWELAQLSKKHVCFNHLAILQMLFQFYDFF